MLARWSLGTSYEGGHAWPAYFMELANEGIDRELEPVERWNYGQQTYVIQCEETLRVKIGTAKHPEARLRLLQIGSSTTLRLIAILAVPERTAHEWLREHRLRGEWFAWGPVVEAYVREHGTPQVQPSARQWRRVWARGASRRGSLSPKGGAQ